MDQIIEFAGNHIQLVAALVVILVLLAQNLIAGGGGKDSVDPVRATELINHEDATVVDVRPIADFNQGHIVGAINIPMSGLANQLKPLEKRKNRPIVVSCRSGAQSAAACRTLRKQGFDKVYNLRGGILAWQNANLPVTRK
jgi:rhodanese-related sulfurtransferase